MLKGSRVLLIAVMLAAILSVWGCASVAANRAEDGDMVRVHYTGTLDDGTVFDSSVDREPIEFTLGAGQMIPGFEKAVLGMKEGETKTVTIPSSEAYGPRNQNLVMEVPREEMPEGMEPQIGQQLQMSQNDGTIVIVTIIEVSENSIKLDANPPLAGKDLTFEIELVEIL